MTTVWIVGQAAARVSAIRRALKAWEVEVEEGATAPDSFDVLLAAPEDVGDQSYPTWVAMTQTPALPTGAAMFILAALDDELLVEAMMLERPGLSAQA